MTFYSDLADLADELLAEFGQAVTIRHRTPGTYDPATGTTTVTTTEQAGTGAVFEFSLSQAGQYFAPDSMIHAGDKQLLLSPLDITAPDIGDQIVIGSTTWAVQAVKTTNPAGTVVLYELLLRH